MKFVYFWEMYDPDEECKAEGIGKSGESIDYVKSSFMPYHTSHIALHDKMKKRLAMKTENNQGNFPISSTKSISFITLSEDEITTV